MPNVMVKYIGPKKVMNVPFPEDGTFPLESMSNVHEIIQFPRGQGIQLTEERAEALLAQSPGVFKIWGPTPKEPKGKKDGQGNQNPVQQTEEPADDHE